MNVMTQSTTQLTFEKFWRWLAEHPGCLLRAGAVDATLFDLPELHWELFEEEDGTPVIQLLRGKTLVGELLIERTEIFNVQGSPDLDEAHKGYWIFELLTGAKEEPHVAYHFLMSHGVEQPQGHQSLKH
jgi:hypothetical protein